VAGEQVCVDLICRCGSKGLQRGRFLRLRIRPAGVARRRLARHDGALPVRWLLARWPAAKSEPVKSWPANLPETTPLVEPVGLGRSRRRAEMVSPQLTKGRMRAVR
jgi:hypothetical protein